MILLPGDSEQPQLLRSNRFGLYEGFFSQIEKGLFHAWSVSIE